MHFGIVQSEHLQRSSLVMISDVYKKKVSDLLAIADIKVNGNREWDLQVHDDRFYQRLLFNGSLGLGEAYMDEWWSAKKLDVFFEKILEAGINKKASKDFNLFWLYLKSKFLNMQNRKRSYEVGKMHYDIGNDNFQLHWPKLKEKYGERFKRMWEYYLLSCAGAFRSREMQLWQFVFAKQGVKGGYQSVR